jgi:hypothetical protein
MDMEWIAGAETARNATLRWAARQAREMGEAKGVPEDYKRACRDIAALFSRPELFQRRDYFSAASP